MRSDSDIKQDVEDEIRWTPNIDPTDIAVAVKNGVVTLTGFVRSYGQKYEAEKAAKRVAGVVGLANDLEVRLPGVDERPDPDIARDAVAAIKSQLPASEQIKVTVNNGWVTLEGEVEWHYQQQSAEKSVRRLKGVKGVSNLISAQAERLAGRGEAQDRGGIPAECGDRRAPRYGRSEQRHDYPQRRCPILGRTARGRTSRLGGARRHESVEPARDQPISTSPRWVATAADRWLARPATWTFADGSKSARPQYRLRTPVR